MLMTQTASFITRGSVTGHDDMGEPIYGPGGAVDVAAWYEPAGFSEDTSAAQQVISGYTLYVPNYARAQFTEADAVILDFDPVEYEVVGEIAYTPDGFITPGFCVARVEKVRG